MDEPTTSASDSNTENLNITYIEHQDIIGENLDITETENVENTDILITFKDYDDFDFIRDNLKNVLYSPQFCGICLVAGDDMSPVGVELEVVTHKGTEVRALEDIVSYVFNNSVKTILASSYMCDKCIDKVLPSYIFIRNTRDSYRIINNCINELNFKVVNAIQQLNPVEDYENSEVLIILENVETPYLEYTAKESKVRSNTVTVKKKKYKKKTYRKPAGYRCVECNIIVQTFKEWKQHERDFHEKPQIQCQICNKVLSTEQSLKIHYKTHAMMKCKICNLLVPDGDLNEHFRLNHEDDKKTCHICNLAFYTNSEINSHMKISHPNADDPDPESTKSQCLLCLKHFEGEELNEHKCKFKCSECSEIPCIHHKYLISYREQIKARASKIKCMDCDYVCHKKDFLIGHANREHLDHISFACDICGQRFYSKVGLRGHIYQFHTESYVCEYCDQEFKGSTNYYENHKKQCALTKRDFKCNECPASFDSFKFLTNHNKRRHIQEIYPCNLCTKTFLTDGKLKEHTVKVHSGLQNRNRRSFTDCVICEKKFDTRADLKRHIRTHGPNAKFPCRTCNIEFDTLKKLHVHRRKHVKSYCERVQCNVCNMELQAACLSQHMLRHAVESGEAPAYSCDVCGKTCSSQVYLRYHKQSHMKPTPCPICEKLIKPAGLQKHIKYHSYKDDPVMREKMKRRYKCQVCDYMASDPSILEAHVNRHHLKVKPYICSVCEKDFCGKLQLTRHMDTHYVTKNYSCEVCDKKFSNKICLRMHLRLHTGERPYYCEICAESFISASALKTHGIKRHSEKSIPCPFCDRMFYIAVEMRQHFKKFHWLHKDKKFDHREVEGLGKEYYHLFEDGRRPRLDDDDDGTSNVIIEEVNE
ncbi:zinc finger protein 93-like [Cydia splendana]|uniref:zinc finger protein 93-like n=1 Tax=Cydia splendana TaxID=1100963 RepID=UPI00213C8E16